MCVYVKGGDSGGYSLSPKSIREVPLSNGLFSQQVEQLLLVTLMATVSGIAASKSENVCFAKRSDIK